MHFGILTFLRRPSKGRPARPGGTATVEAPIREAEPTPEHATSTPTLDAEDGPRPFASSLYRYRLELPGAWRESPTTVRPGSPSVDRFTNEAAGLSVGIWSDSCPARALAPVPVRERAATIPIQSGAAIPFVSYPAGGTGDDLYLEGRWLRDGRRWTVHAQLAAPRREEAIVALRGLLATLCLDG